MKLKVFTAFDSKLAVHLQPFFLPTRGAAIRTFGDAATDPSHQFNKHAGDYTLFEIGEFDEETGTFLNYDAKVNLGTARELAAKLPQPTM